MALQDYGNLDGPARDFAEQKGYGPRDVDLNGWTLLHHAARISEHARGMTYVVE